MEKQFWTDAWKEGRTGFHQGQFNDKLTRYFPLFQASPGEKVLVPLSGKSRDMIWLSQQGLNVRGIELYEEAVKDFFPENKLSSPKLVSDAVYRTYSAGSISISCGDFFQFAEPESYEYAYDRAALVALPPEMREDYVTVIHRSLKKSGECLLITFEYDQEVLQGPPFSITDEEIGWLYKKRFSIEKLESERPALENNRFDTVTSLRQNVYRLKKL